ncbi:SRPBCC family protein [Mycobacterium sp.]|uniref:SRPBCC family protein n=1 Tax=Mycobacterium sp. TaxID=1785 RepID=UPI002DADBC3D|nr:SRPBCC family protein [Mycobacterium sp.]
MAPVDVNVETVIARPRDVVAAYAADPDNATAWYVNIKSVEWKTPRPLTVGSQFTFTAAFLGRKLTYTYEVVEFVPARRFVMRTAEGPFPMETTYEWDEAEPDSTRMRLRNRGEPSGFSGVAAPMMAVAMKRANMKDLKRLKAILESQGG